MNEEDKPMAYVSPNPQPATRNPQPDCAKPNSQPAIRNPQPNCENPNPQLVTRNSQPDCANPQPENDAQPPPLSSFEGDAPFLEVPLFGNQTVRLDPRTPQVCEGWSFRENGGPVPNPFTRTVLKFLHERFSEHEAPFILDIGAGGGALSLLAALHPYCRGWAFEPAPLPFEILQSNLAANGLNGRLRAWPIAISDKTGRTVLGIPGFGRNANSASAGSAGRYGDRFEYEAAADTVDHLFRSHGPPGLDIVLIDVGGGELPVLCGANETFNAYRPDILVATNRELARRFNHDPTNTVRMLEFWGYRGRRLTGEAMYFRHPDRPGKRRIRFPASGERPSELKCAIVKQQYDDHGPWESVKWDTTSPARLFDRWPWKTTYWEMGCLLEADWYVLPFCNDCLYFRNAVVNHRYGNRKAVFDRHVRDVTMPEDVPWEDYDVVISFDPILRPVPGMRTVFAYFSNEHYDPNYRRSLQQPLPGYDLFLDHMVRSPWWIETLPRAVSFPYPRDPGTIRRVFPGAGMGEEKVWMDLRTILLFAHGVYGAIPDMDIARAMELLRGHLGIPVWNRGINYTSMHYEDPPGWGDPVDILRGMAGCRYAVSIATWAGQAVCDAASLGLISFGSPIVEYHKMICHPECLCADLPDLARKMRRVRESRDLQTEIIDWQDRSLKDWMVDYPLGVLEQAVELKRASTANRAFRKDGGRRKDLCLPMDIDNLGEGSEITNIHRLCDDAVEAINTVRFETALHRVSQALWLHPEIPELYYLAAVALDRSGKREDARQFLDKCLAMKPDYRPAQQLLESYRLNAASTEGVPWDLGKYCRLDDQGRIVLPPGVRRVWLDVGAHCCEYTLPHLRVQEDLCVIAFEPLPQYWRRLRDTHPRLLALPFAVSTQNGTAVFRQTAFAASSTLLPIDSEVVSEWKCCGGVDAENAFNVVNEFETPTVRLDEVIPRIPLDVVEFLKVDAQGHDLEVVQSAGEYLSRVIRIQVEVPTTRKPLYVGAASKTEVIVWLHEHGFRLSEIEHMPNDQEQNLTFLNVRSRRVEEG